MQEERMFEETEEKQDEKPLSQSEREELEALRNEKESSKDKVTMNIYDRVNISEKTLNIVIVGGCLAMVALIVLAAIFN